MTSTLSTRHDVLMTSVPTLESSTEPVLRFETGLPGFPEAREFVLVRLDDAGTVFSLRSSEDAGLRFLAVPPAMFFPAYAPEASPTTRSPTSGCATPQKRWSCCS